MCRCSGNNHHGEKSGRPRLSVQRPAGTMDGSHRFQKGQAVVPGDQSEGKLRGPHPEKDLGISSVPHLSHAASDTLRMLQPCQPAADAGLPVHSGRGGPGCVHERTVNELLPKGFRLMNEKSRNLWMRPITGCALPGMSGWNRLFLTHWRINDHGAGPKFYGCPPGLNRCTDERLYNRCNIHGEFAIYRRIASDSFEPADEWVRYRCRASTAGAE